jgi:hypothetical protein
MMDGEKIANAIERLIEGKIAKQKKGPGNWTQMDELTNRRFVEKAKADLAKCFPKNVLFLKEPKAKPKA